ncbi:MAG: hypothetical protein IJG23_02880, partial [Clostridia bacterium]|nr:hypothetical protein [Clostridia bacterium]
ASFEAVWLTPINENAVELAKNSKREAIWAQFPYGYTRIASFEHPIHFVCFVCSANPTVTKRIVPTTVLSAFFSWASETSKKLNVGSMFNLSS